MKAEISWSENVRFDASTQSGHEITMDGSPDHGGKNEGARPMELLLVGMGGCTGFDVVGILKKARAELASLKIELEAERAEEVPSVFTKIHVHFILKGSGLKETLGRAGHRTVGREILLRLNYAGANSRYHAQF